MQVNNGFIKLDDVIRSHIADKGYSTLHKYIRFLHWGIEALHIWREDSGFGVKTVELQMDNLKRVFFPSDYIGWTKIATKVGDRMVPFTRDKTISRGDLETEVTFREVLSNQFLYRYEFVNYYNSLGFYDSFNLYGSGHNGVGYFNINQQDGYFQFSSDVNTNKVWLEYISDGFDPSTETLVSARAGRLIKEYINYCEAKHKFGSNHGETRARQRDYEQEWMNVKLRTDNLTYEGILDATTRSMTHSIKKR